ncbi:MAG: hypothetical protein HYX78_01155 [Armatimonadetes bacterium]|nr:hypothetical protein [Armatimonadota bacterium]
MAIFHDKVTAVVLVALTAIFVCIFGYEVWTYSLHAGKSYRWMYVSRIEQDESPYLRLFVQNAEPVKLTLAGKESRDVSDGLRYQQKTKLGQAIVQLNGECSFDFYFAGERREAVLLRVLLMDRGKEAAREELPIGFLRSALDIFSRKKQGCVRISVGPDNHLTTALVSGVRVAGRSEAGDR